MSTMLEERTCILGGQSRPRSVFGNITMGQFVTLLGVALGWVVITFITRSLIPVILGAAVVGAMVWVFNRQTAVGDSWLRRQADRVWFGTAMRGVRLPFWTLTRGGRSDWAPTPGAVPRVVGRIRELVDAPGEGTAPVAVLHQADRKGEFLDESYLTAVVEILGTGDGLREISHTNAQGIRFGKLLNGMASSERPVDQLDIETRVLPTDAAVARERVRAMVVPNCPPVLRDAMEELADLAAHSSETYRTFMTVRMPKGALAAGMRTGGGVDPDEALMEQALETLQGVISRVGFAGYPVRGVLGPRRVAALIRHVYLPSRSPDDVTDLESVVDGWSAAYRVTWRAVVVDDDEGGEWWHAVCSVPFDAWPTVPQHVRWLESLVTDLPGAVIRTVKAQHALMSRRETLARGSLSLLYDAAAIASARDKGQITTGEDEMQASAGRRVLDNVVYGKSAGDRPALRILISARSEHELERARRTITDQAETEADIERLMWHDGRHHQAMLLCCPLGRGIRR